MIPAFTIPFPNHGAVSQLDPQFESLPPAACTPLCILICTPVIRLSRSRTHNGSLWPSHYVPNPLTGVFKSSLLPDVSLTVSCFGNSSPARPFFSPSSPTPQILYLFLPCCFCHVITSISSASCFSFEPPLPPPPNLRFPPVFPFSGISLPCHSACQEKRETFG